MILSQTDLILRAIQVTSLWATALWEDTPLAPTALRAPLERGRPIRLTRSGAGSGGWGQGATSKGQHLSLQWEPLWKQAGSQRPQVSAAPKDSTETWSSQALLKDRETRVCPKERFGRSHWDENAETAVARHVRVTLPSLSPCKHCSGSPQPNRNISLQEARTVV